MLVVDTSTMIGVAVEETYKLYFSLTVSWVSALIVIDLYPI